MAIDRKGYNKEDVLCVLFIRKDRYKDEQVRPRLHYAGTRRIRYETIPNTVLALRLHYAGTVMR